MHKLFRSTNYGFHASVFIGAVILFVIFMRNFSELDAVVILRFILNLLLWAFLLAMCFIIIAIKKLKKIDGFLFSCEAEEFAAIYEGFSKIRKLDKDTRVFVSLQLSTGYLNIGNLSAAGILIEGFDESHFRRSRFGAESLVQRMFVYYNNLVDYYLRINDIEKAAAALAKLKELVENPKLKRFKAHNKMSGEQCFMLYQLLINMANDNYNGCEEFLSGYFDNAQHQIHKVTAKHILAKIYMHENRPDEAKQAYEYVAKHGGTTYHRREALEYLNANSQ